MKLKEIISILESFGYNRQPTPWNENLYVFWDRNYIDIVWCIDCKRFSFEESNGDVDRINVTIYNSMWGVPETIIYNVYDIIELQKAIIYGNDLQCD